MKEFKITFLALSRTTELEMKSESEMNEIINDFLFAFASEIDYHNFKINMQTLQQNTQQFRTKIDVIVQKYKSSEPKMQQLNSYFKNLKEEEYFFSFTNANFNLEQRFQFYNYLVALESGSDYDMLTQKIDELFVVLRKKHDINASIKRT
jgi:hypothetical protein